jgi:hypothetical protein
VEGDTCITVRRIKRHAFERGIAAGKKIHRHCHKDVEQPELRRRARDGREEYADGRRNVSPEVWRNFDGGRDLATFEASFELVVTRNRQSFDEIANGLPAKSDPPEPEPHSSHS